jgi:hypothetical protein
MYTLSSVYSENQLKEFSKQSAYPYYFSADTMRFFNSRLLSDFHHTNDGIIFITSEKFDYKSPRLYSVRLMTENGNVKNLSEFQEFAYPYQARKFAKEEAKRLNS